MNTSTDQTDILRRANEMGLSTLLETLGIHFIEVRAGYVAATMPVDLRTVQPYGLLHGGASAALAETLGSFGSHFIVADQGGLAVGIELNINHLRSVKTGKVTGKATIIQQGRSTHVWSIEITDESGTLIAVSRLTVLIKSKALKE